MVIKECGVCKTPFESIFVTRDKYCSKECRYKSKYLNRGIKGLCRECGKVPIEKGWRCNSCKVVANIKNFQQKYGISEQDYEKILINQGGLCAICRKKNRGTVAHLRLGIDHNHITGHIRGLLCNYCNSNLGWFEKYKETVLQQLERIVDVSGL